MPSYSNALIGHKKMIYVDIARKWPVTHRICRRGRTTLTNSREETSEVAAEEASGISGGGMRPAAVAAPIHGRKFHFRSEQADTNAPLHREAVIVPRFEMGIGATGVAVPKLAAGNAMTVQSA